MSKKYLNIRTSVVNGFMLANSVLFTSILFALWLAPAESAATMTQVFAGIGVGVAGIMGAVMTCGHPNDPGM